MRAEQEFYAAAVEESSVTSIVGDRVYPDVAPEDAATPLVVYERRAAEPVTTIHDGKPVASKVSIAATAWATTRIVAEQLGDALEVALRRAGVTINRFGHFDPATACYAASIDFEIWEFP